MRIKTIQTIQSNKTQDHDRNRNYDSNHILAAHSQKPSSNITGTFTSHPSKETYSANKNYPEDIKNLYRKYFKYTDNFMRDTLKDSPGKKIKNHTGQNNVKAMRDNLNKKLNLNGLVRYTQAPQMSEERMKLMTFMKTSIYLKSIVNRSNWVKSKDQCDFRKMKK